MSTENNILDRFERQIDLLLQKYERYKRENAILREKQASLLNEKEDLLKKHTMVIKAIESIIVKLKKLEKENVNSGT